MDTKISDLLNHINDPTPLILNQFTDLETAPAGEPWDSLRQIAESPILSNRCMGVIANGVLTSGKTTFLFSATILSKMLKNATGDDNISFSGTTYARTLARLTDPSLAFLRCVSPPSDFKSNKRRAGTYEIIYQPILIHLKSSKDV